MRASQFFISTLKEAPAEAELVSNRLMLRAGLIRKLGSGLYTWMPLGLKVLRKIEAIVRDEMNRAGAIELLMPAVQPAELWHESGRWNEFGPQMLKIKDRHERDFCFGPTHEEVISDIARRELKSYRQLPVNFYQIQTKFRDEIRPRFGVMRAREFIMKDAYSFAADYAGLQATYRSMYETYTRIFTRLGLKFRVVAADPGAIGGSLSHEFHVLADSGEDVIAFCPNSDYAANIELAEAIAPAHGRATAKETMRKIPTPGKQTCAEVADFLHLPIERTVKSVVVKSTGALSMLLVRGDHEINAVKAGKLPQLAGFMLASEDEVARAADCKPGYIGPVGMRAMPIIADRTVATMSDFVCGANAAGFHLTGVNWGRDLPEPALVADIRSVAAGDPSPDGKGALEICRGIEVGHIFQLRTKYSAAMGVNFIDEQGQNRVAEMGCYGIGVSRIAAAAIEQNFDERGIVFPRAIAPFDVAIVPVGYAKSKAVREAADQLHDDLSARGCDVLLDDREERLGVMLAEQELIGIPHRVVIGERALNNGEIEYQRRDNKTATLITLQDAAAQLQSKICA